MNKTKICWTRDAEGNPGYTWSPVTGCLHGCPYCYARRIAERFARKGDDWCHDCSQPEDKRLHEQRYKNGSSAFRYGFAPTYHPYRLSEPQRRKKSAKIFVSSMGDLFGEWVPDEWINQVLDACAKAPQHTYIFLTKNPDRYVEYFEGPWQDFAPQLVPALPKWLFGTTITCQKDLDAIDRPTMQYLDFLSIEPLLGPVDLEEDIYYEGDYANWKLPWIIVGAQTGPAAVKPKPEWIQSIIDQCQMYEVPLWLKDNLGWHKTIQEQPEL